MIDTLGTRVHIAGELTACSEKCTFTKEKHICTVGYFLSLMYIDIDLTCKVAQSMHSKLIAQSRIVVLSTMTLSLLWQSLLVRVPFISSQPHPIMTASHRLLIASMRSPDYQRSISS